MTRKRSVMATDRTVLRARSFMFNVSTSHSQEAANKCKLLVDLHIHGVSTELTA